MDCDFNNATDNIIEYNNLYGAQLQLSTCQNNLFYNNTFRNPAGINAQSSSSNNFWNNTEKGNYWHDYGGVDANDDGIGDSAHSFGGGTDYLPIWDDGPNIISIYIDNNGVSGNGEHGLFLEDSSFNSIVDNNITSNGVIFNPRLDVVGVAGTTGLKASFGAGIFLDPSEGNYVAGNYVNNNAQNGIHLYLTKFLLSGVKVLDNAF